MTRNPSFLVVVLVALPFASSCAWSEKRAHEPCYDIRSPKTGGNWTTEGSAQASETGIDLTLSFGEVGSIWNQKPVNFSSWELELDFEILRSRSQGRHADGFGLFYVRDPKHGDTFGTIPEFVGLGIVFDTYRNGVQRSIEPPFLQAHVLDGSVPYAWKGDGYPSALVSIHAPVIEKSNSKLTVRYHDKALAVILKYKEVNATEWSKNEFQLRDVNLPKGYYFGIGAACGTFCSNHRVLGLKVYSLDGPEPSTQDLPRANSDELFQGDEYVCWNTLRPKTFASSAVVLGYTIDIARPVFFARVISNGRTHPALYIPSLDTYYVYVFPYGRNTTKMRAGNAQILSYRHSRSSHLLWQRYPTDRLESKSFIDRLVAVGYSNEGDVLNICRSETQESESSSALGLGVFSISSGVCIYVNQIDDEHFGIRKTSRFSMPFTLPTGAS